MAGEARWLPRTEGDLQPDSRGDARRLPSPRRRDLEPRMAARVRIASDVPVDGVRAARAADHGPTQGDRRPVRRLRQDEPPTEPLLQPPPRADSPTSQTVVGRIVRRLVVFAAVVCG